uniref:E3 ubiquitin-protein ligase UPL2-like n=1 Tax=Tanacetum cinerariifolium TaxID=118510 RepID=A0A699KYK3_TANCI|nr:E3 ubiquitin-protein ligase UPL2-like [Tanacetum cinerariifolium]
MPRAIIGDTFLTKSYIPTVSFYKPIENRCIHEGRVVDQPYYKSNGIERLFTNVRFNCLFKINEPIVPRFILDFYSQVKVQTDENCYLLVLFMIHHEFITPSLAQFGQILIIPYNGQGVFTNEWDLASLAYSQETEGPYHIDIPTLNDIQLRQDMKRWEELIRENVFGLGGHRNHLPASLAHMLYCIVAEEQYNLTYFFVKRIEYARATSTANLPYGMFLTRLYRYVMEHYPHLENGIHNVVDRVLLASSDVVLSNLIPALVANANMLRERFTCRYNWTLFGMLPRSRRDKKPEEVQKMKEKVEEKSQHSKSQTNHEWAPDEAYYEEEIELIKYWQMTKYKPMNNAIEKQLKQRNND